MTPVVLTPSTKRKLPTDSSQGLSSKKRRSFMHNFAFEFLPSSIFNSSSTPASGTVPSLFPCCLKWLLVAFNLRVELFVLVRHWCSLLKCSLHYFPILINSVCLCSCVIHVTWIEQKPNSFLFSVLLISHTWNSDVLSYFLVPMYHSGYTPVSFLVHKSIKIAYASSLLKVVAFCLLNA